MKYTLNYLHEPESPDVPLLGGHCMQLPQTGESVWLALPTREQHQGFARTDGDVTPEVFDGQRQGATEQLAAGVAHQLENREFHLLSLCIKVRFEKKIFNAK